MEILARVRSGATVQRLLSHPRLPLVAAWDDDRPAIRIWEYGDGHLRECGALGVGSAVYVEDIGYERFERTPSAGTAEASVVDMDQLDLTDGTRVWQSGDLNAVSETSATDLSWLKIRAATNRLT
ncbi:hypothetical protein ACFYPH_24200 [Micromonospora sp. NPDC005252]|uniref:hypothetical protein n=1 Tax=Micromonospora sp. NPDC005252 TaxID=3364228 RepID=UPI0036B69423